MMTLTMVWFEVIFENDDIRVIDDVRVSGH